MKNFIGRIFKNDFIAITVLGLIQGILTSVSLEPFNAPLTGWLMPWPLFYFSERFKSSIPRLLLAGAACSLFFCMFTFYWITDLLKNFAGMGTVASLTAFIPFSIVFNLQFPAFVLFFGISLRDRFRTNLKPRWLTAGTFALICDYCIPKLFPYHWGNFIGGNPYIVQVADITGIHGLTFLAFAVSYFIYRLLHRIISELKGRECGTNRMSPLKHIIETKSLKRLWPVPLLFLLCLSYGILRLHQILDLQKSLATVRITIINPNAPPEDKRFLNARILDTLMSDTIPGLVDQAAKAASGTLDLVVLPESAVPFLCADDTPAARRRHRYAPESEILPQLIAYNWDVDVFLNETVFKSTSNGQGGTETKIYNSSVLYSRDGRRRDSYHKRRLLAFGEYIPGENILKLLRLQKIAREIIGSSRFSEGASSNLIAYSTRKKEKPLKHPGPVSFGSVRGMNPREFEKIFPKERRFAAAGYFLPLICYESLFPDLVRSFFENSEQLNPDFIVNVTQDGWYGKTTETYQHFELARIRAVETRRALVRSVNNGAAGFVDIAGRYVKPLVGPIKTEPGTTGFQVWDVPVNRNTMTFYVLFGDTWMMIPVFITVALWLWRTSGAGKRIRGVIIRRPRH